MESFSKGHLENVSLFSSMIRRTQEAVPSWEKFFPKYEDDISLLEFKLENVPSVSIGELEVVITRFIAFGINERDNGRLFFGRESFDYMRAWWHIYC